MTASRACNYLQNAAATTYKKFLQFYAKRSCKKQVYHKTGIFSSKKQPESIGNIPKFSLFFVFLRIDKSGIYRMIFGCLSSNAPCGVRDNPSHNQCISFNVTFRSSSGVSGQRKQFLSSLFIRIQKPDPSH